MDQAIEQAADLLYAVCSACYPKARFPLPELTGDQFPLPVNMGCVDGRAFPLAELTGRVDREVVGWVHP